MKLYKEPLCDWQSAPKTLTEHDEKSILHKTAVLKATEPKRVVQGKSEGIAELCNRAINKRIQCNRKILSSVVETVILAGRQNIALRGHRDDSQHHKSP